MCLRAGSRSCARSFLAKGPTTHLPLVESRQDHSVDQAKLADTILDALGRFPPQDGTIGSTNRRRAADVGNAASGPQRCNWMKLTWRAALGAIFLAGCRSGAGSADAAARPDAALAVGFEPPPEVIV